jgi:hypothetical protein
MSERLPYEQHLNQQWIEVPLPDEDMAWADMKRRLEEKDDDKIIFWWRPGCAVWGLLLILLGLGWWILAKRGKEVKEEKENIVRVEKDSVAQKNNLRDIQLKDTSKDTSFVNTNESGSKVNEGKKTQEIEKEPQTENNSVVSEPVVREKEKRPRPKNISAAPRRQVVKRETGNKKVNTVSSKQPVADDSETNTKSENPKPETSKTDTTVTAVPEKIDSAKKPVTDSPTVKKNNPVDSSKKSSLSFSAGIAVQQQLPIAGQKATPYNSLGRKGSLLDYIPSVYVRLNKKDKWFIQAEFKYGAPQYTKEILYHQRIIQDTGTVPRFETTTSNRLKKTFYHQLPLSFSYFIKPNWSVGGGLVWNKFYGAVSDQEIIKHDNVTSTNTVLFKGIVVTKKDTTNSFASSYFQGVVETQYQWKRFSVGVRYNFGLEPYLRITIPGQPEKKEKNSNIQLFLRFELFRKK